MRIHHYELSQSSGKTKGNGPDDYSYLIEVNSDATGAHKSSLIESLNKDYKTKEDNQFT